MRKRSDDITRGRTKATDLMRVAEPSCSRKEAAFSLPELLLVIGIFTIIGTASYPIINNIGSASAYHKSQAKAEALTAAKILYHKNDPNAAGAWSSAADPSAKFDLLKPYLHGVDSDTTLTEFAAEPPYHEFVLGNSTRDLVSIAQPD